MSAATKNTTKQSSGFTADEKAAMKERAKELKASTNKAEAEADVLAKIAEMPESDRIMAEKIHAIVKANAPELSAKTWYGMPAYARNGKIVCFFKSAHKFDSRYATFGFEEHANLDEGVMWPTSYALLEITPAVEAQIAALVRQAVR